MIRDAEAKNKKICYQTGKEGSELPVSHMVIANRTQKVESCVHKPRDMKSNKRTKVGICDAKWNLRLYRAFAGRNICLKLYARLTKSTSAYIVPLGIFLRDGKRKWIKERREQSELEGSMTDIIVEVQWGVIFWIFWTKEDIQAQISRLSCADRQRFPIGLVSEKGWHFSADPAIPKIAQIITKFSISTTRR